MKSVRTLRIACIAIFVMALACVDAKADIVREEPQPTILYSATIIESGPDSSLVPLLTSASLLLTLQKRPSVGVYAFVGRVRGDYGRLIGALRSQGYYAGTVRLYLSYDGHSIEGMDPRVVDFLTKVPDGKKVKIRLEVIPGPLFTVGHVTLLPEENNNPIILSENERRQIRFSSGSPAVAADILSVQGQLLNYLQEEGYALAEVHTPKAVVRINEKKIDIRLVMKKGPKVVVGPFSLHGLHNVKSDYVYRRLALQRGQLYQPSAIENARVDLGSTGLFSTVQVEALGDVKEISRADSCVSGVTETVPLGFDFSEAKRHRLTLDLGYSTDLGGRAGVSWMHRNLFGSGEQLKIAALATGLGGTSQQGLGYDLYTNFDKPDFGLKGQTLSLRVEAVRQLLYSYHQTAFLVKGGVSRPVGKDWFASAGVSFEQERILQFGVSRDYFIGSLPVQINYDSTHRSNPIEPAIRGVRLLVGITPSISLENNTSLFIPMNAQISTYFDLHNLKITPPGKTIIAIRGTIGSIQGASSWNLPPDQRFYAGGPATIRGFRYQGVGPQYGNTKYAIGGTSMDAGTIELRQKLPKNFGVVAFTDAGQVSAGATPGSGKIRIGYGGGVRYFTPIGPARIDIAFPMNRPNRGDKWELYMGLGETF